MASSSPTSDNDPLEGNNQGLVSKNEVEMNQLATSAEGIADFQPHSHPDSAVTTSSTPGMVPMTISAAEPEPSHNPTNEFASSAEAPQDASSLQPAAAADTTTADSAAPDLSRLDSVAIGPSSERAIHLPVTNSANPVCIITLLLTSGARHPYKLDEKYLTKRSVTVPGVTESGKKDPFSISVYTLKELILREWREEWEAQPSSPSSIRLIHFGRLLDDKTPLKECRFNPDTPNVVHMTIKPQEVVDDEEATKSKALRGERDGADRTPGCRCVIL